MYKVFISGSISIKNIDALVHERIRTITESGYEIIVGDADGVDYSVQSMLSDFMYSSVTVYCSGTSPRNNIGNWSVRCVESKSKPGTKEFFTAKDVVMAEDCDYGLMVWDTKSTGTLKNIMELLNRHKYSLVYVNKLKKFVKIKHVSDMNELFSIMSKSSFLRASDKLKMSSNFGVVNLQPALF